ncbi:MAG: phytanoyl-CoA dioxygenase family protein [Gammaproteobacteria bacterium]|nr:phytanoyl-CoA dioxygenase family protein [Gammaproteobacteria bacterium]
MSVRKIQPIVDLALALPRFSNDDRLLGPMYELMGNEPVLMEEKLNYKQLVPAMDLFNVPTDDDRFSIHNDWAYYQVNGYPREIIFSAITIDDCHEGNGPIRVFPGTHGEHIGPRRVRNGLEVPRGTVDPAAAVSVLAPAGVVLLFHSCLIHTSGTNASGAPRRMMIYSHYPKAAGLGYDIRNGPNRLRESPWESRYQRLKAEGVFVDAFRVAPEHDGESG